MLSSFFTFILLFSLTSSSLSPIPGPLPLRSVESSKSTGCIPVMLALHIILYVLLGTSLTFSLIELGLAGYGTSLYSGNQEVASYNYYGGLTYSTVHVTPPAILIFVLFACCWSILVCTAALVLPWYYSRKEFVTPKLNATLGISTIVVYFVTSVFWLASFADIVAELGGGGSVFDVVNAVIAFAVLLW